MQFHNENAVAIEVDPLTVDRVRERAEHKDYSGLCIGTLEILVYGAPADVARALEEERGYACLVEAIQQTDPPPAGGLPTGDAPPHDDDLDPTWDKEVNAAGVPPEVMAESAPPPPPPAKHGKGGKHK